MIFSVQDVPVSHCQMIVCQGDERILSSSLSSVPLWVCRACAHRGLDNIPALICIEEAKNVLFLGDQPFTAVASGKEEHVKIDVIKLLGPLLGTVEAICSVAICVNAPQLISGLVPLVSCWHMPD
jgi:hypothetical protein